MKYKNKVFCSCGTKIMHLSFPTSKIFVTFVLLVIRSDFVQRFISALFSDIQKKIIPFSHFKYYF